MTDREMALIGDELNRVFEIGRVFDGSDEDLNKYLRYLTSEPILNTAVQYRAINRCQIISTIKTFRLVDQLQKKNDQVQRQNKNLTIIIIILTIVTILMSGFSYWQARDSADELNKWLRLQEVQFEKLIKLEQDQTYQIQQKTGKSIPRAR